MVARVESEIIGRKRGQQDFGLCFENGEAEEALIVSRCVTQLSVSVSLCAAENEIVLGRSLYRDQKER